MDDSGKRVRAQCSVCASAGLTECIALPDVPIYCSAVCDTRQHALDMPRGDIRLVFCRRCGHVFNAAFDPAAVDYIVGYENSLHASAHFQGYAQELANRLLERYDLRGKQVVEIGAGQGEFLVLLCAGGIGHGLGIDPCDVPSRDHAADLPLEFIQDYYSREYADRPADLICCRHTLEHIARPRDLLDEIRATIAAGGLDPVVFFEVPNVLYTLRDMGIWDLIYEHCSYFSPASLRYLFNACGYDVRALDTVYTGQFLTIDATASARPAAVDSTPDEPALDELDGLVAAFGQRHRAKVATWQRALADMAAAGQRVAVWGGGSKGVTFLNTADTGATIDCVVDINPRKQGFFVPGTGQAIIGPKALAARAIDTILVMNPVYRDEIQTTARELGLAAEIHCV